jgi:hypothetical protein
MSSLILTLISVPLRYPSMSFCRLRLDIRCHLFCFSFAGLSEVCLRVSYFAGLALSQSSKMAHFFAIIGEDCSAMAGSLAAHWNSCWEWIVINLSTTLWYGKWITLSRQQQCAWRFEMKWSYSCLSCIKMPQHGPCPLWNIFWVI